MFAFSTGTGFCPSATAGLGLAATSDCGKFIGSSCAGGSFVAAKPCWSAWLAGCGSGSPGTNGWPGMLGAPPNSKGGVCGPSAGLVAIGVAEGDGGTGSLIKRPATLGCSSPNGFSVGFAVNSARVPSGCLPSKRRANSSIWLSSWWVGEAITGRTMVGASSPCPP